MQHSTQTTATRTRTCKTCKQVKVFKFLKTRILTSGSPCKVFVDEEGRQWRGAACSPCSAPPPQPKKVKSDVLSPIGDMELKPADEESTVIAKPSRGCTVCSKATYNYYMCHDCHKSRGTSRRCTVSLYGVTL